MRKNTEKDFWDRVDKGGPLPEYNPQLGPCWLWKGRLNRNGYGEFDIDGDCGMAHRLAWLFLKGSLPKETLDHLCRVRKCVNPDHVEDVGAVENVLRGFGPPAQNSRKTHCKRGHPLFGRNLITRFDGRACRICSNEIWARCARTRRLRKRTGIEYNQG
jgi:hypothetical protein